MPKLWVPLTDLVRCPLRQELRSQKKYSNIRYLCVTLPCPALVDSYHIDLLYSSPFSSSFWQVEMLLQKAAEHHWVVDLSAQVEVQWWWLVLDHCPSCRSTSISHMAVLSPSWQWGAAVWYLLVSSWWKEISHSTYSFRPENLSPRLLILIHGQTAVTCHSPLSLPVLKPPSLVSLLSLHYWCH